MNIVDNIIINMWSKTNFIMKPMRLHNNQFPKSEDIYCANALINLEQASKNSIVQCLWSISLSAGSSDVSSRGSTAYKQQWYL